jgi:hypothetical protein
MMKRNLWLVLAVVVVSLVFPFTAVSQDSTPALNQSAIMVYRDQTAVIPVFKMYIYIDGREYQTTKKGLLGKVKYEEKPIGLSETVTISLNDGTHSIYVKAGTMQSEEVAFSVNQSILSFIITLEGTGTGAKLVLTQR